MEFWTKRALKSLLLPGGVILLGAWLILSQTWVPFSATGINFFFYAVFIAVLLLAWRFHATRVLFCGTMLLLAHHVIDWFAHRMSVGSAHVAFEAVAWLVPINFILLTVFPERGMQDRTLASFLGLLFFESVIVVRLARPEEPPAFLHTAFMQSYYLKVPQPALILFIAAFVFMILRSGRFHKAIDSGMLWALAASLVALENRGAGKLGTAYFGVAGFLLASCIVESSYSLAYQDELTGLHSRRAFNDALVRLKAPYAIAAVDIDHFKSINDNYGHDTGDQVLRLVASRLARVTGGGQPFRVGGEEFTILFPAKTALEIGDHLELLRMEIEGSSFRFRTGVDRRKTQRDSERRAASSGRKTTAAQPSSTGTLSVTVSIGIAESHPKAKVDDVIQQADKALYRAKQGGRNRIEIALARVNQKRRKFATRAGKS